MDGRTVDTALEHNVDLDLENIAIVSTIYILIYIQ